MASNQPTVSLYYEYTKSTGNINLVADIRIELEDNDISFSFQYYNETRTLKITCKLIPGTLNIWTKTQKINGVITGLATNLNDSQTIRDYIIPRTMYDEFTVVTTCISPSGSIEGEVTNNTSSNTGILISA